MKKLTILCALAIFAITISCTKGDSTMQLNGTEQALPEELKGLKVYKVQTSSLEHVFVGLLDGYRSTSTTHSTGKTKQTTILLTKDDQVATYNQEDIKYEDDEIIVLRKK